MIQETERGYQFEEERRRRDSLHQVDGVDGHVQMEVSSRLCLKYDIVRK